MNGLFVAIFCCIYFGLTRASSKLYYMDEQCGKFVDMDVLALESVRVQLTKFQVYHNSMDCVFRVKAPKQKLFEVKVLKNLIDGGENCTSDFLQIYDGPELNKILPGLDRHVCSSSVLKPSYTSSGDVLTIRFRSDPTDVTDGFRLLLTAYRNDVNGECTDTEFQCKSNDRCISDRLVCDRFEDCTDASDECLLSTPAIIGLAVGGVVFFLAVIGLIVCICCYKKRRRNTGSTRNLHDNSDGMFSPDDSTENDIKYYRPRSQLQPVYDVVPYRPTSTYSVNGQYLTNSKSDRSSGRHVWITAPPELEYVSPYNHH